MTAPIIPLPNENDLLARLRRLEGDVQELKRVCEELQARIEKVEPHEGTWF